MSLGEGRRAEEDNYTRKEMYSYRILLGCGIKNSRKKKSPNAFSKSPNAF